MKLTQNNTLAQIEDQLVELVLSNPTRKDVWFLDEFNQDFDEDELILIYDRISEIKNEYCLNDIEIVDYEH